MVAMTEILSADSVLYQICTFAPEDCQEHVFNMLINMVGPHGLEPWTKGL